MKSCNRGRVHLGEFDQLLIRIGVNELLNHHVTSTDTYNELTVHDLGVDLLGSKHVETASKTSDGYLTVGPLDVFSKELIDSVSLDGSVASYLGLLDNGNLSSKLVDLLLLHGEQGLKFLDLLLSTGDLGLHHVGSLIEVVEFGQLLLVEDVEAADLLAVSLKRLGDFKGLLAERLKLFISELEAVERLLDLSALLIEGGNKSIADLGQLRDLLIILLDVSGNIVLFSLHEILFSERNLVDKDRGDLLFGGFPSVLVDKTLVNLVFDLHELKEESLILLIEELAKFFNFGEVSGDTLVFVEVVVDGISDRSESLSV